MLNAGQQAKLIQFGQALIDQNNAHIIISPMKPGSGFWFGGGNMVEAVDGTFYLVGRYRNFGDSRTGLGVGERGLKLAIFESCDRGKTFTKKLAFPKPTLNVGERQVLSIEGAALHLTDDGVELFVSTEKTGIGYPEELRDFHKPNTGVWTIERLSASAIDGLANTEIQTIFECRDPRFLHVKDPVVYDNSDGDTKLVFCTHPFNWSSSNSAYAVRRKQSAAFDAPDYTFFPRGCTWDVAMTRMTCLLTVPQVGSFAGIDPVALAFYDGGESLRNYEQHSQAVQRPRGYSCEEIGGLAWTLSADPAKIERLSVNLPLFISPQGTGCSRYVDVLETKEGFYATWQQSQADLSQPLVMNFLNRQEAEKILA